MHLTGWSAAATLRCLAVTLHPTRGECNVTATGGSAFVKTVPPFLFPVGKYSYVLYISFVYHRITFVSKTNVGLLEWTAQ